MKSLAGELTENEKWSIKGAFMREFGYEDCCISEHPNSLRCGNPEIESGNEVLLGDAEECYKILKSNFFSSNAVQSLSHVLAMCAAITASAAATSNNN